MAREHDHSALPSSAQGGLPFDPVDLTALRVRQADLARILGVSRSRVCQLVKDGTIPVEWDGRINPERAVQGILRHCDPRRLQSRLLRPVHTAIRDLEAERDQLAAERDQLAALAYEQRLVLRQVFREALEGAALVTRFAEAIEDRASGKEEVAEIEAIFDEVAEALIGADLASLARGADPELVAAVRALDPEMFDDGPTGAHPEDGPDLAAADLDAEVIAALDAYLAAAEVDADD